jgi:SAM-dependent methyltransferase
MPNNILRQIMLPLKAIDRALPKSGLIYEVGSGTGSIGAFLAQKYPTRQVVCIDTNVKKIHQAKNLSVLHNINFQLEDAVNYSYLKCDGIVMSDFLHHLDLQQQNKILSSTTKSLNKGGTLIIKEIDLGDGILMILSRLWDFLLYPKDSIFYRKKSEWKKILGNLGYSVQVSRQVHWFPGSTYLYICIKK